MNRCESCNVNIFESERQCPLCSCVMDKTNPSPVEYPPYHELAKKRSHLRNIPLFLSVSSALICAFINLFTHQKGDIIWSIIVCAAIMFCYLIYNIIGTPFKRYGAKVLYSYIFLSILVIVIDFTTGMLFWSTDFVFPFLSLAVTLYLTILCVRNKRTFSEYFGYILVIAIISFLPVLLFILGLNNYGWGAFVALLSCIIIAFGLYLFADKNLKNEIKKRFHI